MENRNEKTIKLVLSAVFLALAQVLPFFTGQIPEIGSMLCPMHIPVIVCGFICGAPWGLAVGFTSPILRSLTMGRPVMFPNAVCMAFELAFYGFVAGFLHKRLPDKKPYIYISLITSMLAGRLVWGVVMFVSLGLTGGGFTLDAFLAGAFTNALPGIIVQLILVPVVVILLENTKLLKGAKEL